MQSRSGIEAGAERADPPCGERSKKSTTPAREPCLGYIVQSSVNRVICQDSYRAQLVFRLANRLPRHFPQFVHAHGFTISSDGYGTDLVDCHESIVTSISLRTSTISGSLLPCMASTHRVMLLRIHFGGSLL